MNLRPRWFYFILIFVLLLVGPAQTQAQAEGQVWITQVNTAAFPTIQVNLLAAAGNGTPLADLAGLQLSENGTPITEVESSQVTVGIETVLVIDANTTINQRDTGATQNRREQVRDSIVAFAQQNMNTSQLDRVHLLVPNAASDAPEFLTDTTGAVFANEVINKINFYVPEDPTDTPLNDMLLAAIERLVSNEGQRYRAIVLYTDGGELDEQLDFDTLIAQAQENHITFYGFILGSRADDSEIENLVRLVEPTGGTYLHMPVPADSAPLYLSLASFSQQTQLSYRSQLATSGDHTLTVNVAGLTAEAVTNLVIEPAEIQILLDNTQPIIRVASTADTPLDEMEPVEQIVVAQVSWPDNHPREVAAAALLIDNQDPLPIETFTLNTNNQMEFTWNISELEAGEYELILQLTDELGLVAESVPLAFTVEIERPVVEAVVPETSATTAAPEVTTETTEEETTANSFLTEQAGIIGIVLGILAILFALFLVVVAFVFFRRRSAAAPVPVPAPAPVHAAYSPEPAADATQILMPAFAIQSAAATLEGLEYAPDHPQPIPLTGSDITIGRDPAHAKVVFQDKSVSRLHARIKLDRGAYVLIDEGSASGTYVNFERVGFTPQPLRDNDEIHIGRVRLRFKASQGAAQDDRTQIFDAPGKARPSAAPPPQADEDTSTEYFQQQPNVGGTPARPQSPSSPPGKPASPSGGNADDVSTQPFMPHQPKKR